MLSYGRVFPASQFLLVYGFCIPAGLGVGLWLLARLGRVELANPLLVTIGGKLWHLGVLVGLIAILAGEATGHEWLEMPRYASVIPRVRFWNILGRVRPWLVWEARSVTSRSPPTEPPWSLMTAHSIGGGLPW